MPARAAAATQTFITAYNPNANTGNSIIDVQFDTDVPATRWRKLIYNASFNSVSAILRMDITRMRVYEHVIDELVKPAMREVIAVARTLGVRLDGDEEGIIEQAVRCDPPEAFFRPSMCQDVEKVSCLSFFAWFDWWLNGVGQLYGNREYSRRTTTGGGKVGCSHADTEDDL